MKKMQIQVRLAEPFWRVVGERRMTVELSNDASVGDLLHQLGVQFPGLHQEFAEAPPLIFIGDEESDAKTKLTEGSQVHLVWPIAGG